jgi:restriction system protein
MGFAEAVFSWCAIVDTKRRFLMSDDRKDGPPPVEGLTPFFQMVEDGSAMIRNFALRSRIDPVVLSSTIEVFPPSLALTEATAIPSLLLQTVIVPGPRTNEGTLIEAVAVPWFDIIAFLKTDPRIAFQISWEKWEEIIAGAYKRAGFDEVILTPRSGDYGRDVIAIKRGIGSVRVIDQVKAYTPPRLVTANDVRALVGVLEMDGAARGFLSTTSDFAPKIESDILLKKVIPSRIQLINGTALFARLEELAKPKT